MLTKTGETTIAQPELWGPDSRIANRSKEVCTSPRVEAVLQKAEHSHDCSGHHTRRQPAYDPQPARDGELSHDAWI
jgi:hypothetical protein